MDREAMQMALEALESDPVSHAGLVSRKQAITALRKALETEKEPFEYWNAVEGWVKIDEVREHFAAHATTPILRANTKIEDVRLACSDAQNSVAHEDPVDLGHATDIPCSKTVVKDARAPRIRITQPLRLGDSRQIVLRHAPEPELGNG